MIFYGKTFAEKQLEQKGRDYDRDMRRKYREGYDNALAEQPFDRATVIEECAKVAETFDCYCGQSGVYAARAIRALKDRP